MMAIHIELIQRTLGLAELDHARLKVVERALYQAAALFVVGQEVMPEWVLKKCKHLAPGRRRMRSHSDGGEP
jgi:hypothetical protein